MKNKILYIILAIVFAVDIILTACIGLNVNLNYGEGYTVTFSVENTTIDMDKLDSIAEEIFGKNNYLIKDVEFFGDSALIKVKEINDDQIISLCDKVNSEFETELEFSDFQLTHISNVKISSLVEPYILPVGLSMLLIVAYFAVRFRGAKQMVTLIRNVGVCAGLYYSIYAIGRVQFNGLTMPIAMGLYVLVVAISTMKFEQEKE